MNIGLFGGTFDPIHIGHITIAECFVQVCELDVCYFIPAKCSPFKQSKINMFSDGERCKLLAEAIKDNPKFLLSKYELEHDSISYTSDTLQYFKALYPNDKIFLLLGTDQTIKFNEWKNYEWIIDNATIVIATRPEPLPATDKKHIDEIFKHHCIWLNNPIVDITSTKIRAKYSNQ
jgi:nicotinate-nucleotide adenylyltransferase